MRLSDFKMKLTYPCASLLQSRGRSQLCLHCATRPLEVGCQEERWQEGDVGRARQRGGSGSSMLNMNV